MASDASQVLGSPELAGTFLSPKGLTKAMSTASAGRMVGGLVGSIAANALNSRGGGEEQGTPKFGGVGYLAVTGQEVAIVRGKKGAFKPKVGDEVVGRRPRNDVQGVELGKGTLKSDLTITFADGGAWEFEIPKVYRKTTERVVQELSPG